MTGGGGVGGGNVAKASVMVCDGSLVRYLSRLEVGIQIFYPYTSTLLSVLVPQKTKYLYRTMARVVSHIPKFGDASKSPSGDTASPTGDAASLSGDAVVSHWRCIISFRDAHPPHSHPHL